MESHGRGPGAIYDKARHLLRMQTDRPNVLRQAIQTCRKGGTVSVPGVYGGVIDKLNFGAAFGKGLTFKMGQTHVQKYMKPLLDKIVNNEIDPTFLITHRDSLLDAADAYQRFSQMDDGCIKVVLNPKLASRQASSRELATVAAPTS